MGRKHIKDPYFVKIGKKGAKKRWESKFTILAKLVKFVPDDLWQNLKGWPTEHLRTLLRAYEKDVK